MTALLPCPSQMRGQHVVAIYRGVQDCWVLCSCGFAGPRRSSDEDAAEAWAAGRAPSASLEGETPEAFKLPTVAGRMTRGSNADFERACLIHIGRLQHGLGPYDSAMLDTFCEAVRMVREYSDNMQAKPASWSPASTEKPVAGLVRGGWVKCPVCGEPDMRRDVEPDEPEAAYIFCTNANCASNGGTNASALRAAPASVREGDEA